MTAPPARPRAGPIVGPGGPGRTGAGVAIFLVSLVVAVATILTVAAGGDAREWSARLRDPITIAVWASGLESADAAAARAADVAGGVDGVRAVRTIDATPIDAVVARIMGAPTRDPAEIRLLSIDTAADASAVAARVEGALHAGGVPARIDDHSWRSSAGLHAAAAAIACAAALGLVAVLFIWLACGRLTRREMTTRQTTLELMRISGASDGFVTGLFARRTIVLAIAAAVLGTAAGAVIAGAWNHYGPASVFDALRPLARADLAWILPWPLVAGVIAALASHLAARSTLRAVP